MRVTIRFIIQSALIAGVLFINPFIFNLRLATPHEVPKVWFILRWIEVTLVAWFFVLRFFARPKHWPDSNIILSLLLFLAAGFASALAGVDFPKSVWGNYWRADGLLTLTHLVAFSILLMLCSTRVVVRLVMAAVAANAAIMTGWIWYEAIRYYSLQPPIGLSFGQPKFLGGYLLVTLPFLLSVATRTRHKSWKFFWITVALLQTGAIGLTGAKTAILGIGLFFLLLSYSFLRSSVGKALTAVAALVFVIVASVMIGSFLTRRQPYFLTAETRDRIFVKGMLAVKQRPLLGWGWANFDYAFRSIDWPYPFTHDVHVDKAHSHLLEILVTAGLVGLLPYLSLVWFTVERLMKRNRVFLLMSLLLFLYHSQTNVISVSEELIFWTIVGLSSS